MNKAILTVKETTSGNNAGPKAKVDVETILCKNGFSKINFTINQKSKMQKLMVSTMKVRNYFKHNHYDEIIMQYPTYSDIVTKSLFRTIGKYDTKLVLFIHDVESLRLHSDDADYIQKEVSLFNKATALIVHNNKMKQWLSDHGVSVHMETLEIFDYLMPDFESKKKVFDKSICFAGNLQKSDFLTKVNLKEATLTLFGPNPQDKYGERVTYKGQYTPEELPKYLNYNFGLVWDGSSVDKCDGIFGSYLKYNNPHKASLYLATGLPIIIWSKSALADFIVHNELGIAINSLNDLDIELAKISSEQYDIMQHNVSNISRKLKNGNYTKQVMNRIENYIKEELI